MEIMTPTFATAFPTNKGKIRDIEPQMNTDFHRCFCRKLVLAAPSVCHCRAFEYFLGSRSFGVIGLIQPESDAGGFAALDGRAAGASNAFMAAKQIPPQVVCCCGRGVRFNPAVSSRTP
jgi:hypothetical protein